MFTQAKEQRQHQEPHQDLAATYKPGICISCVQMNREDVLNGEIEDTQLNFCCFI